MQAGGDEEVLLDSASLPDVVAKHGQRRPAGGSGGNACPAMDTWPIFDRDGLRATPSFGSCAQDGTLVETKADPAFVPDEFGGKPG